MNILAIETATPACSVALGVSGRVFKRHEVVPRRHSEVVLDFVQCVLSEARISLSELDGIVCGVGPGSFMGVRLAVSVTQGLAYAQNIPVLALSTLRILAQCAYEEYETKTCLAAWDARMHEMYYGGYRLGPHGVMECEVEDQLVKPADFILPAWSQMNAVGNAWREYSSDISASVLNDVTLIDGVFPRATAMLSLAESAELSTEFSPVQTLKPLYLRSAV